VPITLHPDGRKAHAPHLKTFRDGWRTLRFFLMYSPRWLFFAPGLLLVVLGLLGGGVLLTGPLRIGSVTFDVHTLVFASLALLCGYQAILFALFAKTFAITEGLMPEDRQLNRFYKVMDLEKGLVLGGGILLLGIALLFAAIWQWRNTGFGSLDYSHTMRWVIPGATLTAIGFQTILSSFFVSILGMRRK
jgi:hypothetical protein